MEHRTLGVPLSALFIAFSLIVSPAAAQSEQNFERWYTASAYVSFLSVPIFSRSGVGFGFASADEHRQGEEQRVTLEFLGGSTPECAHGLNRFGFVEENVGEIGHETVEAHYFGLMTAGGEESLADAKAALEAKKGDPVPFVAAEASMSRGSVRYSVRHMLLPAGSRGSNAGQLLRRVKAEFAEPRPGPEPEGESFGARSMATFLNSLREAIQPPAPTTRAGSFTTARPFACTPKSVPMPRQERNSANR
jgi:hypothetical protein